MVAVPSIGLLQWWYELSLSLQAFYPTTQRLLYLPMPQNRHAVVDYVATKIEGTVY